MTHKNTVVTRFPPSPTGNLHVGGARTALFNFLFARHHGGRFYLRIENTDCERSRPEYEKDITDALSWLHLEADHETVWRQSERGDVYRKHLRKLIESGAAFVSKEEGEGKRSEVIRLKNPGTVVRFADLIRGEISFDTKELGDFVIAKSAEEPLYHLAVVVDDNEMGVTHVIRGEDHISNTPRQILIQEALGFPRPAYAHIPLILAPDRTKLSKRHGAVAVTEYREQGFLAPAFVNFLALLGWHPPDDREVFSIDELVQLFDLSRVQKGGAVFDLEKLRWFNREYLRKDPTFHGKIREKLVELIPEAKAYTERLGAVTMLLGERVSTLSDIAESVREGEAGFFFNAPSFPKNILSWRGRESPETIRTHLGEVLKIVKKLPETFSPSAIKEDVFPYAEKAGRGEVLWPFRVALTGRERSPDPFTVASVLGREETLRRIASAVNLVS